MSETAEGGMLKEKNQTKVKAVEHKPFTSKGLKAVPTPVATPDNPNIAHTFKLNEFLNQEGTGLEFNKKGKLKEGRKPREVGIDRDLHNQYETFLDNHFRTLAEMQKYHPEILESPGHEHELALYKKLVKDGRPSAEEINNLLGTEKGWVLTTQLMEEQLDLKLFGLGLAAARLPEAERNKIAEELEIWINGQPLTDKLKPEKLKGKAKELFRFNKGRINLSLKPNHATFEAIQKSPEEAAYLKAFGIDINDYDVVSHNDPKTGKITDHIEPVKGRIVESVDPKAKQQELMGMLYTRSAFYEALGIPGKMLDAGPEQFLTNFSQNPEQTAARWQLRLLEELKPNSDEFIKKDLTLPRDKDNEKPKYLQIQMYMEARRKIMMEMATEYVKGAREHKEGSTFTDRITNKITQRQAEGPVLAARQKEITDKREGLTDQKNTLSEEQAKLQARRQEVEQARKDLLEAQKELKGYKINNVDGIQKQVDYYRKRLTQLNDKDSYHRLSQVAVQKHQTDRITALNLIAANVDKKAQATVAAQVNAGFDSTIKEEKEYWERESEAAKKLIADLTSLDTKFRNAQQQLLGETDKNREVTQLSQNLKNDLKTFTDWHIAIDDLQSKSVDELLTIINGKYTPPTSNEGWPSKDNNKPELRHQLYHAIIEAKTIAEATRIEPNFVNLDTKLSLLNNAPWQIPENELLLLQTANIQAILTSRNAGITIPSSTDIDDARKAAELRSTSRSTIYESDLKTIDANDRRLQSQADQIKKDLEREVKQFKVTQDLVSRRDDLNGDTGLITEKSEDFTKIETVTNTDRGYSSAEQGMQKGYLEFMEYMFHYKEREDRVEYFKTISSVITPETLAELLDGSLSLGKGKDIDQVLPELKARIDLRSIDSRKLSEVFNDIVDLYKKDADAM